MICFTAILNKLSPFCHWIQFLKGHCHGLTCASVRSKTWKRQPDVFELHARIFNMSSTCDLQIRREKEQLGDGKESMMAERNNRERSRKAINVLGPSCHVAIEYAKSINSWNFISAEKAWKQNFTLSGSEDLSKRWCLEKRALYSKLWIFFMTIRCGTQRTEHNDENNDITNTKTFEKNTHEYFVQVRCRLWSSQFVHTLWLRQVGQLFSLHN